MALAQNDRITQLTLASRLGIAVGLANIYLKRLARKGYIKCVRVRPNRLAALNSLAAARLERKQSSRHFGTGEAAELAYLSLKEFGIEPVVVFDATGGERLLGRPH